MWCTSPDMCQWHIVPPPGWLVGTVWWLEAIYLTPSFVALLQFTIYLHFFNLQLCDQNTTQSAGWNIYNFGPLSQQHQVKHKVAFLSNLSTCESQQIPCFRQIWLRRNGSTFTITLKHETSSFVENRFSKVCSWFTFQGQPGSTISKNQLNRAKHSCSLKTLEQPLYRVGH